MAPIADARERLRRTLDNALAGCTYASSREEDGRMLVVVARRADGRQVSVRFRGVKESTMSSPPDAGSAIRLRGIALEGGPSLLGLLIPRLRSPAIGYVRVRIEAGAARLDIVCQDAEWWEEDAAPG